MVRRTFANEVDPVRISIAIERLLVATYPNVWTPARVDLDALPSNFRDTGAVVEDSPTLRVGREKFVLEAGIPKVRQFAAISAVSGEFECRLHSNSWRQAQYAFGNYTPTASATSAATVTSVHSDGLTFVTASTPSTPVAVGQQVILGTNADFDTSDVLEVRIGSIDATNQIFTVESPPITDIASIAAIFEMGVYERVEQLIGGRNINYYSILGVADFIDGVQVVHEMQKVEPSDEFEEALRADANGQIPLSFMAHGWNTVVNSCDTLIVAKRHYFVPLDDSC